jgi:hypothetical protein
MTTGAYGPLKLMITTAGGGQMQMIMVFVPQGRVINPKTQATPTKLAA